MTLEDKTYRLNLLIANLVATKNNSPASFVFDCSFVDYTIKLVRNK
jgi:hypothetical protein